jgi:hypothetical protein
MIYSSIPRTNNPEELYKKIYPVTNLNKEFKEQAFLPVPFAL